MSAACAVTVACEAMVSIVPVVVTSIGVFELAASSVMVAPGAPVTVLVKPDETMRYSGSAPASPGVKSAAVAPEL